MSDSKALAQAIVDMDAAIEALDENEHPRFPGSWTPEFTAARADFDAKMDAAKAKQAENYRAFLAAEKPGQDFSDRDLAQLSRLASFALKRVMGL